MQVTPLKYHITNGLLGMKHERPVMGIRQKEADLSIQQPEADVRIKTTPGEMHIDQSQAFQDAGLKDAFERTREYVEYAKSKWFSDLAKMSAQGDQMMNIHNGPVLAQIAKVNGETPMKETGLGYIPSSHFAVKLDYQPAKVEVDIKANEPIIRSRVNPPEFNFQKWQVQNYLIHKPFIDIEYVGNHIDMKS
ncbi:DUF6470 family protein [Bacillus salitolerans]|uniref:DUF6470 family protein n=1 Tax=Bacillus salitolerans TaxID=1437434 RepID=A0ABW4LRT5_9BACI